MGAYMSVPNTEKNEISGHTDWFTYGVSSMQGWRIQQEDAHNCVPDFDPIRHASLFAVYDGHGGAEVAEYCAAHLPDFLRKLPAYSEKDPAEALKQLFLDFDASLTTPEARSVLRSLMKKSSSDEDASDNAVDEADDSEEEENDSDINALCAEAEQPLESVLKRYSGEEGLPPDVKDLLDRQKQSGTEQDGPSSSQKRARRPRHTDSDADADESVDKKAKSDKDKASQPTANDPDNNDQKPDRDATSTQGQEEVDESEDETVDFDPATAAADEDEEDSDDDVEEEEEDEDSEDDEDCEEEEDDDDENVENLGLRLPAVLKGQGDEEPGVDSGTTACVALLLPMNGVVKLFVANAGDSRAVLCRGAAAVELSVDHKPEDEDERSRITAAGGTVTRDGRVNGGLNLSRALGDHSYKQTAHLSLADQMITPCPDVTQFDLIPGSDDFLVIACDGVWNSMTSQEVVDFIYDRLHPKSTTDSAGDNALDEEEKKPEEEAAKLSQICGELFDHCLAPNTEGDGTGCDNMTCIIVRFRNLDALAKLSPPQSDQIKSSQPQDDRKRAANGDVATVTNGSSPTSVKRLKTDLSEDISNPPLSNGATVE